MGKDQIQKRELEVRKTENKCNDEASASWVLELKQTERKKKGQLHDLVSHDYVM